VLVKAVVVVVFWLVYGHWAGFDRSSPSAVAIYFPSLVWEGT